MENISTLPTYELRSFARWVAKATEAYFEDPKVQERFKKWQEERAREAE